MGHMARTPTRTGYAVHLSDFGDRDPLADIADRTVKWEHNDPDHGRARAYTWQTPEHHLVIAVTIETLAAESDETLRVAFIHQQQADVLNLRTPKLHMFDRFFHLREGWMRPGSDHAFHALARLRKYAHIYHARTLGGLRDPADPADPATSGQAVGSVSEWDWSDNSRMLALIAAGFDDLDDILTLVQALRQTGEINDHTRTRLMYTLASQHWLTAAEIAYWWPHTTQVIYPEPVAELVGLELTVEDIASYRGSTLDPLDHSYSEDRNVFVKRVRAVRQAVDDGWTAPARLVLEETAPPGCTPQAWADIWAQFMPTTRASKYVEAGLTLPEAAEFVLSDSGPTDETLRMMAALAGPASQAP